MSGLVEQLMVYNVPFVMKDSVPNIYEHWICLLYTSILTGECQKLVEQSCEQDKGSGNGSHRNFVHPGFSFQMEIQRAAGTALWYR